MLRSIFALFAFFCSMGAVPMTVFAAESDALVVKPEARDTKSAPYLTSGEIEEASPRIVGTCPTIEDGYGPESWVEGPVNGIPDELTCPVGTVPAVLGTTDAHKVGASGQNRLDLDRGVALAPVRGWDGRICMIPATPTASIRHKKTVNSAVYACVKVEAFDSPQTAAPIPGPVGERGPSGLACWDYNGDGTLDRREDINGNGVADIGDCQPGRVVVQGGFAIETGLYAGGTLESMGQPNDVGLIGIYISPQWVFGQNWLFILRGAVAAGPDKTTNVVGSLEVTHNFGGWRLGGGPLARGMYTDNIVAPAAWAAGPQLTFTVEVVPDWLNLSVQPAFVWWVDNLAEREGRGAEIHGYLGIPLGTRN